MTAGEVERPYDVTGWTIPMQLGVDVPAVVTIQEPATEHRLTRITNIDQVRTDLALPLSKTGASPIANPVSDPLRIGIYRGWTSNMDEGWTRFVFDTFNVPYKSVRDAEIRQGGLLNSFDVIVLPSQRAAQIIDGNPSANYPAEYTGGLTQNGVNNLKSFVEGGGTLVCFDASCELPIKQFKLPLRNVLEGERNSDFFGPGSIVALELDRTDPLVRGVSSPLDAYFINSSAFEATDPAVRVAARYSKENVLRSGWLLGEQKLRGRIALAAVSHGKGRVVLFAFRPQHRGQTWGTLPLIWNSLNTGRN